MAVPDTEPNWKTFLPQARAVLQAIREPSEAMVTEAEASYSNPYGSAEPYGGGPFGDAIAPVDDIWRDMIDVALREGPDA